MSSSGDVSCSDCKHCNLPWRVEPCSTCCKDDNKSKFVEPFTQEDARMSRACADCRFEKVSFVNAPCAGCYCTYGHAVPKKNFTPRDKALKFSSLAELQRVESLVHGDEVRMRGLWHRVASCKHMYWMHLDAPRHNLQAFINAGMTYRAAHEYIKGIIPSVEDELTWPTMSLGSLYKVCCVMLSDSRFDGSEPMHEVESPVAPADPSILPESAPDHRTIMDALDLFNAGELLEGDHVMLGGCMHIVNSNYLRNLNAENDHVFKTLGMDVNAKVAFAQRVYGTDTYCSGIWPVSKDKEFDALTRMVAVLYGMLAAKRDRLEAEKEANNAERIKKQESLRNMRAILDSYQQDEDDAWATAQEANNVWEHEKSLRVELENQIKALETELA